MISSEDGGGFNVTVSGLNAFPRGRGVYATLAPASATLLHSMASIVQDAMQGEGLSAWHHPPHLTLASTSEQSRATGIDSIPVTAWTEWKEHDFGTAAVHTLNLSAAPDVAPKDSETGYYFCLEQLPLDESVMLTREPAAEAVVDDDDLLLPTLRDRAGKTTLRIFDFDGTLFRSPVPNPSRWTPQALDTPRRSTKTDGLGWF
eukprot:SAG22_NODE_9157_length_607_cov_0.553150_1_plen_202_part_11